MRDSFDAIAASRHERDPRSSILTGVCRHFGVIFHGICHGWRELHPGLKRNCGVKVIFNHEQGRGMAADLSRPELKECGTLAPGEFFYVHPLDRGLTKRGRIVWRDGVPSVVMEENSEPSSKARRRAG